MRRPTTREASAGRVCRRRAVRRRSVMSRRCYSSRAPFRARVRLRPPPILASGCPLAIGVIHKAGAVVPQTPASRGVRRPPASGRASPAFASLTRGPQADPPGGGAQGRQKPGRLTTNQRALVFDDHVLPHSTSVHTGFAANTEKRTGRCFAAATSRGGGRRRTRWCSSTPQRSRSPATATGDSASPRRGRVRRKSQRQHTKA